MIRPSPRRAGLLVAVLLFAAPRAAHADVFAIPFAGLKFGGSTSIVDLELAAGKKKFVVGAAALKLDQGVIGYELEVSHISGYFENADEVGPLALLKHGSYVTDLTASVVFALPPSFTAGGLRPYAVLGAGLIHAEAEDIIEVFQIRRTVPTINIGAGAIGLFTNNVGVRFDVRHLRSLNKDASLGLIGRRISYSRFTLGLLLRL